MRELRIHLARYVAPQQLRYKMNCKVSKIWRTTQQWSEEKSVMKGNWSSGWQQTVIDEAHSSELHKRQWACVCIRYGNYGRFEHGFNFQPIYQVDGLQQVLPTNIIVIFWQCQCHYCCTNFMESVVRTYYKHCCVTCIMHFTHCATWLFCVIYHQNMVKICQVLSRIMVRKNFSNFAAVYQHSGGKVEDTITGAQTISSRISHWTNFKTDQPLLKLWLKAKCHFLRHSIYYKQSSPCQVR